MTNASLIQHLITRAARATLLVSLPEGVILESNQAACDLLGLSANPPHRPTLREVLEIPQQSSLRDYFSQNPPTPDQANDILFKLAGNDRKIPINIELQRVDHQGGFCALVSFHTALPGKSASTVDVFYTLFDKCPLPVICNTAEGLVIRINEAFAQLSGYVPEELVGRSVLDLKLWHHQEEQEFVWEILEKQDRVDDLEVILRRKDNSSVLCQLSAQIVERDGLKIAITAVRDISQQKKVEQDLQDSQALFRDFFYSNPVATIITSPTGTIHMVNPAFCKASGYSEEDVLGKTSLEMGFWRNPDERERMVAAIREQGHLDHLEAQFYGKGDRLITGLVSSRAIQDQGELRIMNILHDITDQKKAAEALIRLDQAKNDFITTAAHELRTPLIAILGYAELLENNAEHHLSEEQKGAYASIICRNSEMLDRLVDDLLDVERIQLGQVLDIRREACSVADLILKAIAAMTLKNPDHRFIVSHTEKLPESLSIDGGRITQVLHNLLGNAVKYSPTGGIINISTSMTEEHIAIAIKDDGIGMTAEQTAQVFDRFYRANPADTHISGIGLGMGIVKQIVEDHGGEVTLFSAPSEGTTVTFTLPTGKYLGN